MHAFTRINRVIGHVIKAMITSLEICTYKYVVVVHYSTSIKRVRCLCPARPPSSTSTPHCRTCRSHHFLFPCSLTVSVLLVAQPPGCHHSDPLHASIHHYWMRSSLAWKTSSCWVRLCLWRDVLIELLMCYMVLCSNPIATGILNVLER
jgi:hypothetical protein